MKKFFQKKSSLGLIALILFYLLTHLAGLLELPVFADEAIYIRWAQLIIDDPSRYFFFAMNDGKTPLLFWLLAPVQFLFANQLFAARFVSVIVGLFQMFVIMNITSLFTKSKKTIYFSGFLVSILPFWYFHHRMVLTDGLMTLFVSLTLYFLIKELLSQKEITSCNFKTIIKSLKEKQTIKTILFAGISFGLALYSKIPAVLFILALFLTGFFVSKPTFANLFLTIKKVSMSLIVGLGLFSLLILVPSFGQLFGRGSDFLFPLGEVFAGKWKETLPSLPTYIGYFINYMTPTLLIFSITGLFTKKNKKAVHFFFWSGILFLLPIAIMGRIVYARYLFPATLFFTLSSVLGLESIYTWIKSNSKKLWSKALLSVVVVLFISNAIATSFIFMFYSITNHTQIPFVSSDVGQYLTKWSSGHGLVETAEFIRLESKDKTIAVATEGLFGSLPDGLTLYFHRRNVDNLYIDGVGYPVVGITPEFANRAEAFDRKWLVINSNRLNFEMDKKYLLQEYCRPFSGPCLQIWDITDLMDKLTI